MDPPFVKIGFDTDVAYPKLTFKGQRFLTEVEIGAVVELRDGEETRRILNESLENEPVSDGEGITSGQVEVAAGSAQPAAEATAKAPSPSPKPKLTPVEEDMFSVPVEDIAPAPPRAAAVESDAEKVVEAVPDEIALAPVAEKPPAQEAAAVVPSQVPAAAPAADDFDAMLESILD